MTLSEHEPTSRLAMDDKQLELFTSFRYTTGTMSPINCAPAEWGSPQYLLSEKDHPDLTIKLRAQRSIKLFVFLNIILRGSGYLATGYM